MEWGGDPETGSGPAILSALTVRSRPGVIRGPSSGGQVAQLVEQRTENPRVGGSIPPLATTILLNINNILIG